METLAYAKLNLSLKVLGQRADGYHQLDMIMQRISLCDEITISKSDGLRVRSGQPLPPDNTLYRAAVAFFKAAGIRGGAQIFVKKNIPLQAGLGGGSSDGAAVLLALNDLYQAGLTKEALMQIGQSIGADVPFFIQGGCARARGTGEIITPLQNNLQCAYLLAKPVGGVSTKEAYALYHEYELSKQNIDIVGAAAAVEAGDIKAFARSAGNDLAPAALRLCPDIEGILGEMRDAQAALVTGSGSCVFGIYGDKKTAQSQMERLSKLSTVQFVYVAENR